MKNLNTDKRLSNVIIRVSNHKISFKLQRDVLFESIEEVMAEDRNHDSDITRKVS